MKIECLKLRRGRFGAMALGLIVLALTEANAALGQEPPKEPWSITSPWRGSSSGTKWKSIFDGEPFDGAGVQPTGGLELVDRDSFHFATFGRLQMLGVGENVPDPIRNRNRIYLFLKETRLGFRAGFEAYKFELQTQLGGEDRVTPDVTLSLLDAVADVPLPLGPNSSIKIGQFRVPYSREGLTDRGYMPFSDRSIQSMGFQMGRDYGLAVQSYQEKFSGTVGVFSGGGVNLPAHYIPEALGVPLLAARVGYNDGVDADIYHVAATDLDIKRTEKAAYINALFMKDSSVGHSTVLNVKYADHNLLNSPVWNPYLGKGGSDVFPPGPTGFRAGDFYLVGGDVVYRKPVGPGKALMFEAQVDWGGYQNQFGRLHETGGRIQGGYLFKPFELDLRYAVLLPDANTGTTDSVGNVFGLGSMPIHQIDPAATWYIKGQNVKLVFDAPLYLSMPVITEPHVGSYVLSDFPNEINSSNLVNPNWNISRRTVVEARLMFQVMF
jgi:hypothetical protein